jgi:acetolactate synthase-1/2/3 large subunit
MVINDNAYRVLAFRQRVQYQGRIYGSLHQNPDLVQLAESFGLRAWRLETPDQADAALDEALGWNGPALIEVITNPEDIPPTNLEAVMGMR